jgi:hypothetical protein
MREIETDEKLLHADAPVDKVDGEAPAAQDAAAVIELLGRYNFRRVAFLAEKVADQLVLARTSGGKRTPEFQDRDIGLLDLPVAVTVVAVAVVAIAVVPVTVAIVRVAVLAGGELLIGL